MHWLICWLISTGSSISAFGSFVMDLYTASSDLDLSLNLSDGKRQCSRNDKVHYLRKVANALYGLQKGEVLLPVYQPFPTSESVMCLDGKNCRFNVSIQLLKLAKFLGLQILRAACVDAGQRSVRGIETVYRAAVPVVKFVQCNTGIECDISVENNDGVLKSKVLGMFATIDTRFRQLCYLVRVSFRPDVFHLINVI